MKLTKIIKISDHGAFEDHIWKYALMLPDFLADWDVWDYWEKERMFSMEAKLSKGDILLDIGTEHGALSALYAKYIVGGESMVLVEPSPEFWPNIRAIWEANGLAKPLASVQAFAGSKSLKPTIAKGFPDAANSERIEKAMAYRYMHDSSGDKIAKIRIDYLVDSLGIEPKGITIDIEGAELEALKGAVKTLKSVKPLVWVSIHPDLMLKNYNASKDDVIEFMTDLGYKATLLAVDHEHHYLFEYSK